MCSSIIYICKCQIQIRTEIKKYQADIDGFVDIVLHWNLAIINRYLIIQYI